MIKRTIAMPVKPKQLTEPKFNAPLWEGIPLVELTDTPSASPCPETPIKEQGVNFER